LLVRSRGVRRGKEGRGSTRKDEEENRNKDEGRKQGRP